MDDILFQGIYVNKNNKPTPENIPVPVNTPLTKLEN